MRSFMNAKLQIPYSNLHAPASVPPTFQSPTNNSHSKVNPIPHLLPSMSATALQAQEKHKHP